MKSRRTARANRRVTRRVKRGGARAAAAAAAVPARFFGPSRKEVITKVIGGETFTITVYYSPSAEIPAADQREIKDFFEGNRLDISTGTIEQNLRDLNWDAVVNVQNVGKPDRTIGTFQWAAWCPQSGPKKLWVHDVSRIQTEKGFTSPTKVLFDFAKEKGGEKRLSHVYLMVDEIDKAGPAEGKPWVWKTLTDIYSRPEYGFSTHVSACRIAEHRYTSMRARLA
jgi:hypothetical protein